MSTILIGVEASERSEDAIAFGRRLADVVGAHVIVVNAYPYSDLSSRASNAAYREALRDDALEIARRMRDQLERINDDDTQIRVAADPSPPRALHRMAHAEQASLVIVGSSHTGRAGRVLPGSTAERLLHGSPCAVAVVPQDYRKHADQPIRRVGVAYNNTDEARAAVTAAASLARALGAELEIIGIVSTEYFTSSGLMGAAGIASLRSDIERHVQESLDEVAAGVPADIVTHTRCATGGPEELLTVQTETLEVLVMGSRGYGPLQAVLTGGISGRLVRTSHCPVIVVPRGVEAPFETLFGPATAATA
ncbi:universal stress protein [Solirubrobacter ginsenosidimutans]|uniref:Universal stress protein n=1 Tax=Solirubrobacter ginsenosidimutans TaxID=490573 RepID=A0A9X3N0E4_9ACTN|nr:universal stress protein [Solirubrobacter ginsenosidimutans]MDA0165011.1 universal stress protein [Solirubrobacter ginsenosidimutans]